MTDYRQALLRIQATLDQMTADAESLLAAPGDAEIGAIVEELRELLVDTAAKIESKLERGEP